MRDFVIPVVEENEPMTFQIGIVTTQGVLLASDRKMVEGHGFRHSIQTPKIIVHKNLEFAHCSAVAIRSQAKLPTQSENNLLNLPTAIRRGCVEL